MIDYETRKKYVEKQQQKNIMEQMFNNFSDKQKQTVTSLQEIHDKAITTLTSEQKKQQMFLEKLGKALVLIFKKIPEKVTLPDVFKIKGDVSIDDLPPINIDNFAEIRKYFKPLEDKLDRVAKQLEEQTRKTEKLQSINTSVTNLDKLEPYFNSLENKISSLAGFIAKIPPPKITLPKQAFQIPKIELPEINIPDPIAPEVTIDMNAVIIELKNLQELLDKPERKQEDLLPVMRKIQEGINNLVTRPIMTPPAVTNVWLNPNQGFLKATDNTVGTTVTKLPSYGQLIDRRAVLIYNNSVNTIYIGGSDVTVATGMPIPSGSYAPPIDAGYNLPIYGIASQVGNDVRVIEISKDQSGTIQE